MHKIPPTAVDERHIALQHWVAQQLDKPQVAGQPVSSDASFRRYFRFAAESGMVVAMDAPPEREDCRPFIAVAELFASAGVNVPAILAQDLRRGFLLLQDLGDDTYLDVLDEYNADALFGDATDALLRIQLASRPGLLPVYDEALLRRELELFTDWYLRRHLGWEIDGPLRALLDKLFAVLVQRALGQASVFVHRDYMPRNLMLSKPNPGVIDFQDAVYGPISYDPICLFKDAFISWPEPRVTGWLQQYWQRAGAAGLPVPPTFSEFQHDCDLMGVQRHLKVIGIFARICHRDGKPAYLEDVPRFLSYLGEVARRYPQLAPLAQILDRVARDSGS